MLAIGPYQRIIPFVNIQEIKIDLDAAGNTFVLISISNEAIRTGSTKRFSNYLYLTPNKAEIDALASNKEKLIKRIKMDAPNRMNLTLSNKDFKLKSNIDGPNGPQVYNNVYTVRRNIAQATGNMYALVVSYKQTSSRYIIGNIAKETILLKGMSPTSTSLYVLNKSFTGYGDVGAIWPSSAHLRAGHIMAGNTHTSAPHPALTQRTILNTKIKDFRILKRADSLSFSPTVSRHVAETYISPIELSRNKEGSVHGFFSLDHLSFAIANTNFGRLIKNDKALLAATQIKDVVVYQKIVKEDASNNELTPGRFKGCSLEQVSRFKRVASLNDGLQIISTFNQNSILNMSFIDQTTKNYSGNMLEYKVEIIFQDQTRETILLATDRLSKSIKKYDSNKPTVTPQISKNLIDIYITTLGTVYGVSPFKTISGSAWQLYLMSMLADVGADAVNNKGRVLKVIRNLAVKLRNVVKPTTNITSGGPNFNSKIYNSNIDGTLRLEKIFAQKYRATDSRSVGLDYLDNIIQNAESPTPVISHAALSVRAAAEVTKYSINNPNVGFINQVGFLTPQAVSLGANPIVIPSTTLGENLSTLGDDSQIRNSLGGSPADGRDTGQFSSLIRSNAEGYQITNLETTKPESVNTLETLAQYGISIVQSNSSLRKFVFDEKIVTPKDIDSQNYLSSGSNFSTVDTSDSAISGSSDSIIKRANLNFRATNSALADELVNQSVTKFNNITRMTNTSNISGSLAFQKSKEDFSLIENSDTMTNVLNFGSIAQVQYLAGYDPQAGIESPSWALLDKNMYDMTVSQNKPLICRLVKMSNTLDVPVAVDLQPLASFFILGNAGSIITFTTSTQTYFNTLKALARRNGDMIEFLTMTDGLYAQNIPFAQSSKGANGVVGLTPSEGLPVTQQITSPGKGY